MLGNGSHTGNVTVIIVYHERDNRHKCLNQKWAAYGIAWQLFFSRFMDDLRVDDCHCEQRQF